MTSKPSSATTAPTRALRRPQRTRQAPPPTHLISTISAASPRASKPNPSSSTSGTPPSLPSSTKTLLLFRSLNLPKHNRITVSELEKAILSFFNSKLLLLPPAASKETSSSSTTTSPSSSPSSLFTARSYILTGNVVLTLPSPTTNLPSLDIPSLIPELQHSLLSHTLNPISTTIFLRTLPSLRYLIDHCPFDLSKEGRKGSKVHVVFLEGRPEVGKVEELRKWMNGAAGAVGERVWWSGEEVVEKGNRRVGRDEREVEGGEDGGGGKEIVLFFPNGHLKSKTNLGVVERCLGMKGGMRGWSVLTGCVQFM